MTDAEERELEALMRRAYGPGADIERDPQALQRLRDLQEARRPSVTIEPGAVEVLDAGASVPVISVSAQPEPEPEPEADPWWERVVERVSRLRRSTVLIALGALALAAVLVVALVLVQRVQTDPLQTGATQVARLAVDEGFEIPSILRSGPNGDVPAYAFEVFHGLRSVVSTGGIFASGTPSDCLVVLYESDARQPDSTSFSGPLLGECAAGGFPASVQFVAGADSFGEELVEAYPDETAFLFVYDSDNNEVVVFAS
ncbi:hypothetical protein M2152_000310 [Microbacteriaceae bacterium SG_E_30_P1]|uniref:Uncharacterized protein n=1 Tax=Antiquaquibacter oligotrophicus TaxID=2880260 RepID=A0ABT6KKZ8_9MICO|nr:hypothetical protein [Antiquaquibacter oligotrophicus]MDH6180128.1 hypothetical protein [Antiquaquibacter oligotrophicus]UDF14121.1 hypothetical protein LH407_04490 [Antiquaquibacter oligotrophicus]